MGDDRGRGRARLVHDAGAADGESVPTAGRGVGRRARPAPTGSRCGRSWPTSHGWGGGPCGRSRARPAPTWAPPQGLRAHLGPRTRARWSRSPGGLRPGQRAGRARRVAGRARPRATSWSGWRASGTASSELADLLRRDGPADPCGPRPGQRGDGQPRLRAGRPGARLRALRGSTWSPRASARAALLLRGAGAGVRARRCRLQIVSTDAGCGRAGRRARSGGSALRAQRVPRAGALLRRRDVRPRRQTLLQFHRRPRVTARRR